MEVQWHTTPVLFPGSPMDGRAWWAAVHGVAKSQTWLSDFTFTLHFHASEKEMATHSRVLAWRVPGTGEPGGLPSLGSHRVRHDWSDLAVGFNRRILLVRSKKHVSRSLFLLNLRTSCLHFSLLNIYRKICSMTGLVRIHGWMADSLTPEYHCVEEGAADQQDHI